MMELGGEDGGGGGGGGGGGLRITLFLTTHKRLGRLLFSLNGTLLNMLTFSR